MHLYCLLPPEAAASHCGHTDWGIKSFYKHHVRAFTETLSPLPPAEKLCPAGQTYQNCSEEEDGLLSGRGVACEHTCESYLLNLTCSTHEPCVPGCSCPPGWVIPAINTDFFVCKSRLEDRPLLMYESVRFIVTFQWLKVKKWRWSMKKPQVISKNVTSQE